MRTRAVLVLVGVLCFAARPAMAQDNSCRPPSRNVLTVCASEGGASASCKSVISETNAYCVCLGYQGFSTTAGSCVGTGVTAERDGNIFSALPGVRGAFLLGAAGVTAASFSPVEGEEKTRALKAWGGTGVVAGALLESVASTAPNPVVIGAVAAAGAYVGAKAIGEEREALGLQSAEDTRKQTGAATAAAGAVVGGIALINKAVGFRWTPPSALRRLRVAPTGRGLFVRWTW